MSNGIGIADWPADERLEGRMLLALHEETDDHTRERLGLELHEVDGAMVSIARNDPSIMLNRTLGLGLLHPITDNGIETIREQYRRAGIDRYFLHVHPADGLAARLASAGLRPHRRWMKFERGTDSPPAARTDLTVREIDAAHGEAFGRIAAPAFGLTAPAAALFTNLPGRPGFHLYMSFDGDTPVGTGLLLIEGADAWFDWGATDPSFRGSQRALLARRVNDAIAAGCNRLLTCTGEEVPGDPQHSWHNIEWAGFRPTRLRENWIPA